MGLVIRFLAYLHRVSPWVDLTHTIRDGAMCALLLATIGPEHAWIPPLMFSIAWEMSNVGARVDDYATYFSGFPPRGWTWVEVGDICGSIVGVLIAYVLLT